MKIMATIFDFNGSGRQIKHDWSDEWLQAYNFSLP